MGWRRGDRADIAAEPVAEEEFVSGEIGGVVALIEDEGLGVDAGDEPFTGWEQFLQLAVHEVGWQFGQVLAMRVGDAPGDGIERGSAQGPDGARGIDGADAAGGGNEIPDGVAFRSLDLLMFTDDAEVLGSEGGGESEANERPVGEEGEFIIAVVPFIAHVVAFVDEARGGADELHRVEDVGEVTVAGEQFVGGASVAGIAGEGVGDLEGGRDFGAVELAIVDGGREMIDVGGVPSAPEGGSAVDIDEVEVVVEDVIDDADKVGGDAGAFGRGLGDEFPEDGVGEGLGGDFIAAGVPLPFPAGVG